MHVHVIACVQIEHLCVIMCMLQHRTQLLSQHPHWHGLLLKP